MISVPQMCETKDYDLILQYAVIYRDTIPYWKQGLVRLVRSTETHSHIDAIKGLGPRIIIESDVVTCQSEKIPWPSHETESHSPTHRSSNNFVGSHTIYACM